MIQPRLFPYTSIEVRYGTKHPMLDDYHIVMVEPSETYIIDIVNMRNQISYGTKFILRLCYTGEGNRILFKLFRSQKNDEYYFNNVRYYRVGPLSNSDSRY